MISKMNNTYKISENKQVLKMMVLLYLLFTKEAFFVGTHLLGRKYEGSETSNSYLIINIISFIFVICIFLFELVKHYKVRNVKLLSAMIVINIVIGISYLFSLSSDAFKNRIITDKFYQYSIWVLPSMFLVYYSLNYERKLSLITVSKSIYWFGIFISLPVVNIIYQVLVLGERGNIGGDNYQSAGYILTLGLGMILIGLKNLKMKRNFIKYLYLLLILIGILVTGARGPTVVSIVMIIFYYFERINIKKLILFVVFILIGSFIIEKLLNNPFFIISLNRVFEFIGNGQINWSGTSGRDSIYIEALTLYLKEPLTGYGFFGYLSQSLNGVYPHNLFLEVMLQGGLLYLTVFMTLIIVYFVKIFRLRSRDYRLFVILIYLTIYQFGMLMFSGSYISHGLFWFLLLFVIFRPEYNSYRKIEATLVEKNLIWKGMNGYENNNDWIIISIYRKNVISR